MKGQCKGFCDIQTKLNCSEAHRLKTYESIKIIGFLEEKVKFFYKIMFLVFVIIIKMYNN